MQFDIKVGDTIIYGSEDFKFEDTIEQDTKTKKYYGVYSGNLAKTGDFLKLEDLLNSYINEWEYVKVIHDKQEFIFNDFRNHIDIIKKKNRIIFTEQITDTIRVEILKVSKNGRYDKEKTYFLKYDGNVLVKITSLGL